MMEGIITTGMSLCQTAAVRTVTGLFTRLTLSLTQPTLRTSVRQLSQEFAGFCQVIIVIIKMTRKTVIQGHPKAQIETDFNYKACCNDESNTLSVLNTTKLAPKTCSERVCFYSDALVHSTWISHQVCTIIPLVLWELIIFSDGNPDMGLTFYFISIKGVAWM